MPASQRTIHTKWQNQQNKALSFVHQFISSVGKITFLGQSVTIGEVSPEPMWSVQQIHEPAESH